MKASNPFSTRSSSARPSQIRTVILVALSCQAVVLSVLLMQGCKPSASSTQLSDLTNSAPETNAASVPSLTATNAASLFETNAPALAATNPPAPVASAKPSVQTIAPLPAPLPALVAADANAAAAKRTCTVIQGDSFYKIALANQISVRALKAVNPGVNPHKLKVGQTLALPTAEVSASALVSSRIASTDAASSTPVAGALYVVKAGDTLARIARTQHVKVKELRALNNLTTDRIMIGQKLKLAEAGLPS